MKRQPAEEELMSYRDTVLELIERSPENLCKLNRLKDELEEVLSELCSYEYDIELPDEVVENIERVSSKSKHILRKEE